jgi:hypothetical protein
VGRLTAYYVSEMLDSFAAKAVKDNLSLKVVIYEAAASKFQALSDGGVIASVSANGTSIAYSPPSSLNASSSQDTAMEAFYFLKAKIDLAEAALEPDATDSEKAAWIKSTITPKKRWSMDHSRVPLW